MLPALGLLVALIAVVVMWTAVPDKTSRAAAAVPEEPVAPSSALQLDSETRATLKALGYL